MSVCVIHATCVSWLGFGLLLRGPSGAGKSDLALRLLNEGARLVADDLVRLERNGDALNASAEGEGGLIELRGHGICRVSVLPQCSVNVVIDLITGSCDRLTEWRYENLLGVQVSVWRLDPQRSSTVDRLKHALCSPRIA